MEYFSKLTIDKEKKILILNEEALQSLDADSGNAKIIILAPLKEEGADEKALYLINVKGSSIGSDKEENKYLQEIFPLDKVRSIEIINDEEPHGIVSISDDVIKSFEKVFGDKAEEFKLAYQENVVGDMKALKDIYGVNGIYHKITKMTFKKNVIGKSNDVESVEEIVKLTKTETV